jgi:hypothetical protein
VHPSIAEQKQYDVLLPYLVEWKSGHCFGWDELLVSHAKATVPIVVENTGSEDLMIFKFFGPDINLDVPMIPQYRPG